MEKLILVNELDEEIGTMSKMEVHQKGLLHRAFSVLVFNDRQEMLIHRRALDKYHSPGLWTNTCCSHPRQQETTLAAAHRRLMEEMGFDCELEFAFKFIYRAELDQDLTEHELDHVFTGTYNADPKPNPDEVNAFKWISLSDLKADMDSFPERYTHWFKLIIHEQY